jgi:hypothetical protein
MILVKCPKCERKLTVEEAKASGVAACPDCGQRFRIPDREAPLSAKTTPERARASSKKRPASKPVPERPRRPDDDEWLQDSTPYEVKDEPEASTAPPVELHRPASDDADDYLDPSTYSFDKEYAKQRKKRQKELKKEAARRTVVFVVVMLLAWIGAGIYAHYQPDWALIPFASGSLIALAGFVWLLVLAFGESAGSGFLVLFLPPYHLYFASKNLDRATRPLILGYVGGFIMVTALAIGGVKLFDPVKKIELPTISYRDSPTTNS